MSWTIRHPMLAYAWLTFLSCFLELGLLVKAIAQGRSLWELGPVLLAFHSANLLSYLVTAPWGASGFALALGVAMLAIAPGGMLGTVIGVLLAKLGVQWLRDDLKAQARPRPMHKALPRLTGFILAFLYAPMVFAALGVVTFAIYLLASRQMAADDRWPTPSVEAGQRAKAGRPRRLARPRPFTVTQYMNGGQWPVLRPIPSRRDGIGVERTVGRNRVSLGGQLRIYLTMAAHSAHYFAFGYGIPLLFAERYGFPVASLGLVYTAGWLGYYLIEWLLPPSPRFVAWGHLGSALGIVILALSPSPWAALLAWTATGFGGGTVFMLSHLRASNPYDAKAMTIWDNGANLIGLLLFLWFWGEGIPLAVDSTAAVDGRRRGDPARLPAFTAMGFLAAACLALAAAWAAVGLRETPQEVEANAVATRQHWRSAGYMEADR